MIKERSPLISVIIACFNDAKYIEKAVCSVEAQTYSDFEIIVVDDGSNKETRNVLNKINAKIDTLIFQENKGVSAARNEGIKRAKGNYIMILDSDDYLEPTFLEKAIDFFKEDKEVRIVSCYANLIHNKTSTKVLKVKGGKLVDFLNNNCALGTSLYKKEDIESIKGYDEAMHLGFEDWEFNIRIMELGGVARVIKEPLYNYRIKSGSRNTMAKKNRIKILKYIITKHKKLYGLYIEDTLPKLFYRMEKLDRENVKLYSSLEYKCGKYLITPLRLLKNLIKRV